jgi:hypothetical protein
LPATITADIIRSLRSSTIILIDAASHPDCRATFPITDRFNKCTLEKS